MCQVLEFSTSGYYAWRDREPSAHAQKDEQLRAKIRRFHAESRGTYGAPRIDLAEGGEHIGRKRVALLMQVDGIWLCRNHHGLIDSDEATYTVEQLHRWKREAEARAEQRLRSGSAAALTASRLYDTPRSPSGKFVGRREEISQLNDLQRGARSTVYKEGCGSFRTASSCSRWSR